MAEVHPMALDDFTIIELADWRGEFCGKLLAGMGANVIKVEPLGGSPTRRIGPFYQDEPGAERSLYFWHYNVGKKGITLDLENGEGRGVFRELLKKADLLLLTSRPGYLADLGLGFETLQADNPRLIVLAMSDFGETGPWRDHKGSDLVFLALGGQTKICGYGPNADGEFDTPPIAPQMWQSSHISCSMATMDALAALWHQRMTGRGQYIDFSIHTAVNTCTENNLSVYEVGRMVSPRRPTYQGDIVSKDGYNMITSGGLFPGEWEREAAMLDEYGMAEDLADERYTIPSARVKEMGHINDVRRKFIAQHNADELMLDAQNRGVIWATVRPPEGSLNDEHFVGRGNFAEIEHSEVGKSFTYPASPWVSPAMPWRHGPRAPQLGEHNDEVYRQLLGFEDSRLDAMRESGVV